MERLTYSMTMKNHLLVAVAGVLAGATATASAPLSAYSEVETSYLYHLADFSGTIPYHWPKLTVDAANREVYVLDRKERDVRVFGESGMELYRFGEGWELGFLLDIAAGENGELFALAREPGMHPVLRCDYRGNLLERIELNGLPEGFEEFQGERIVYRHRKLYLVDEGDLQVVVAGLDGTVERGYDVPALLDFASEEKKKTEGASIDGFDVDIEGNFWFTIATMFSAYRMAPDGTAVAFGTAGGAPGKFGVIAGIAAGENGFVYVADRLRCVVLVFDRNLEFYREFGYRGERPDNLVVPRDIALNADTGRLYVGQAAARGVSVFRLAYN